MGAGGGREERGEISTTVMIISTSLIQPLYGVRRTTRERFIEYIEHFVEYLDILFSYIGQNN